MTSDPAMNPASEPPVDRPAESASHESSDDTKPSSAQTQPAADPDASKSLPTDEAAESESNQPQPADSTTSFRDKIKIGSRKTGDAAETPASKPQLAGSAHTAEVEPTEMPPPPTPPGRPAKVPKPSVRDPLTPDLEQEIEAAMAGASMEELVSANVGSPEAEQVELDSRRPGTVVRKHGDNVFFTLGGRNEGVASVRDFKEEPSIGDTVDVVAVRFNPDDGLYELKVAGAAVNVQDWSDLTEGAVVEARVTGSNTGGLECVVGHIRGFIPASQVSLYRVDDLAEYYEQKLPCVVTEANERKRNLVLSHRALLEREREEQRQKLLESLSPGDVVEGVVRNVRDFGAFVDLGGVDGLIHISQLSWDRVNHPSEVLQEGQKVRVKIEKVDPQTGKISLSYRDLLDHPWTGADAKYPSGSTVRGVVSRIANFGAFVKIAPGIEGLVHISELAHHRVVQVANVVKEGDEVEVKVLSVDPQQQRMSLSLKQAQPLPESKSKPADEEPDEPPREMAVPKRGGPLKGGTNRPTGGDQFGLNW